MLSGLSGGKSELEAQNWPKTIMNGFVRIKGGGLFNKWNIRFLVLSSNGRMWYFKKETSTNPSKKQPIIVRDMKFCSSTMKEHCIAVEISRKKNFYFFVDNEQTKERWISKLSECGGIEDKEDFGHVEQTKEKKSLEYSEGKYSKSVKLVLVGAQAVGKSCIILRAVKGQFLDNESSTIGASQIRDKVRIYLGNNISLRFDIWDTAGNERYKSMNLGIYLPGADVVLILYDVTNNSTLSRAKEWVGDCREKLDGNMLIFLAGNKSDLDVEVDTDEVREYCEEEDLPFLGLVSAKTGKGVEEAFQRMREKYLEVWMNKDKLETSSSSFSHPTTTKYSEEEEKLEKQEILIKKTEKEEIRKEEIYEAEGLFDEEEVEGEENEPQEIEEEINSITTTKLLDPRKRQQHQPKSNFIGELMKKAVSQSSSSTIHHLSWKHVVNQQLVNCTFQIMARGGASGKNNYYIEIISDDKMKPTTDKNSVFQKGDKAGQIRRYQNSRIEKIMISNRLERILIQMKEERSLFSRVEEVKVVRPRQLIFQSLEGEKYEEEFRSLVHEIQVIFEDVVELESEETDDKIDTNERGEFFANIAEIYQLLCVSYQSPPLKEIVTKLSRPSFHFSFSDPREIKAVLEDKENRNLHLPLVFSSLGWSSTIRFIDLSGLDLELKELLTFWKECVVNNSRQITHVRLDGIEALPKAIPLIAQTYKEGGPGKENLGIRLESLSLRNTAILDDDIIPLLEALEENKYLQHLDLSLNKLTENINPALEKAVVQSKRNKLSEVNLESNEIHSIVKSFRVKLKYEGNPVHSFEKEGGVSTTQLIGGSVEEYHLNEEDLEYGEVLYVAPGGGTKIVRGKWIGSEVVIKCFSIYNLPQKEMLKKELYLGIGLAHPCVISTYGWTEKSKQLSIILESMDTDLAHILHRNEENSQMKKIFWKDRMHIIRCIVSGMVYLHSKKIYHLDLKPGNILCSFDSKLVKITDFGLSEQKSLDVSSFSSDTRKGTAIYIAPESFSTGSYGKPSDIYSFGILLYEIVFLKIPFFEQDFGSQEEAASRISQEGIRPFIDKNMVSEFVEGENERIVDQESFDERDILEEEVVWKWVGLMRKCWQVDKKKRPTFEKVFKEFFFQTRQKK